MRKFSVLPLKMYTRYTALVQKGNKDIIKTKFMNPASHHVWCRVLFGFRCDLFAGLL